MDRRGAASNGKTLSPMWNSRTEISSPLFSLLSLERERFKRFFSSSLPPPFFSPPPPFLKRSKFVAGCMRGISIGTIRSLSRMNARMKNSRGQIYGWINRRLYEDRCVSPCVGGRRILKRKKEGKERNDENRHGIRFVAIVNGS